MKGNIEQQRGIRKERKSSTFVLKNIGNQVKRSGGEGFRRCCFLASFSSDGNQYTSKNRESDPGSHVGDYMAVILVPFSCYKLCKTLVISSGLRTHSTKSCVDKGCKRSSFHHYHSRIVLAHFFQFMVCGTRYSSLWTGKVVHWGGVL